ncbi:MAG: alpha/beta fold hydrolase [Pseudomonadota bacterium]
MKVAGIRCAGGMNIAPGLPLSRVKMHRSLYFLVMAWLVLISASPCLAAIDAAINASTLSELQEHLLRRSPELDRFRSRGPFSVAMHADREVALSNTERIKADLYLSAPAQKAPLVIFVHGHDSSKEAHSRQAMHVASWGMHSLTVQLPNQGPWARNGKTLSRLVRFISRTPEAIDARIDSGKIVIVGHSFGGAAVAVALADGAPAAGGILLDPAADRGIPPLFKNIRKPVLVLGADDELATTLNRHLFYRSIRSRIAELSIRDAVHEDGQYPSDYALQNHGHDPDTTEALQITFVSAVTVAALSLAASGTFDNAWKSYGVMFQNGKFFNARRK